ncbi:MAG: hypothetical protein DCC68_22020 [Planctomycetota bacterium]|nr:MAG: hypothetical protein DCC68_22020 [Planctomycetota bacterium]
MSVKFGFGRTSKSHRDYNQHDLRTSWEVGETARVFQSLFHDSLMRFVWKVETVFSPPASIGLLFDFAPGTRDEFLKLVDERAFPPKTFQEAMRDHFTPKVLVPDNPGRNHRDAWWRQAAAGAAIGASFRQAGTQTSMHIAISRDQADVHVDRNGFVVNRDGYTHWDLNKLLAHFAVDLAGDKAPWLVPSISVVNGRNRPIFQATLSPWIGVDLPSKDGLDRTAIRIGLAITGRFGSTR